MVCTTGFNIPLNNPPTWAAGLFVVTVTVPALTTRAVPVGLTMAVPDGDTVPSVPLMDNPEMMMLASAVRDTEPAEEDIAVPVTLTEIFPPVWTVTLPAEAVSEVPEGETLASPFSTVLPTAPVRLVPVGDTTAVPVSVTVPVLEVMLVPVAFTVTFTPEVAGLNAQISEE